MTPTDRRHLFRCAVAVTVVTGTAMLVGGPWGGTARASELSASNLVSYAAPQLGFGGYNWNGRVRQIAAMWRVPRISSHSRSGNASTWIGAQDRVGDFIQIGTEENLDNTGTVSYELFWSDPLVNFVPQLLGAVNAGDRISVSMTQKGFGWTIKASDSADSLKVDRPIEYGFGDTFTFAEWIQENPSSYSSGLPTIPYPTISDTTFRDLAVNGRDPHLSLADGLVLITSSGRFRVPTREGGDSFAFVSPTPAQFRYLSGLSPSDGEAVAFGNALGHWQSLSSGERSSDIQAFISAVASVAKSLSGSRWPSTAATAIARYVAQCRTESQLLHRWIDAGEESRGAAFAAWLSAEVKRQSLATTASTALGLPPFT